jgi:3-hydroxybutyrate dehydrogenase
MMNLNGKTALVTGSTSGIGLGIAKVLAQAGAQLVLNGFGDSSHARAEVAALGKIPGYHDADLRDVGQIEAMMRYAESTFGGVDIVINNAGIQHVAPVEQFPVDKWNDIIAINLSSVFHTTRLALPGMRQRNWGRIINIASVHGLVASKEKSAYVAAKHAVVGLTKTVALETARSGITCNAICPGWVLTPLVQQQIDKRIAEGVDPEQASAQLLAEKQPSGEFVTPQQLGEMALFLCSDAAARCAARRGTWTAAGWRSKPQASRRSEHRQKAFHRARALEAPPGDGDIGLQRRPAERVIADVRLLDAGH